MPVVTDEEKSGKDASGEGKARAAVVDTSAGWGRLFGDGEPSPAFLDKLDGLPMRKSGAKADQDKVRERTVPRPASHYGVRSTERGCEEAGVAGGAATREKVSASPGGASRRPAGKSHRRGGHGSNGSRVFTAAEMADMRAAVVTKGFGNT
jgi:hypothetical protein